MLVYVIIGLVYMFLIEWYLRMDKSVKSMRWLDRLFHIFLWPASISFAIYIIVKNLNNNNYN